MEDINAFDDCGGIALALLESKLNHDTEAFNVLTDNVHIHEVIWSACALAAHIAQQAASALRFIDSGEPVGDDADNGMWRVFSVVVEAEPFTPDDPIIDAASNAYAARDMFLRSLRDSVADTVPDSQGRTHLRVTFWDGWEDDETSYEVAIGVGLALERLFMFDMASTTLPDNAYEFAEVAAEKLAGYHRFVAAVSGRS